MQLDYGKNSRNENAFENGEKKTQKIDDYFDDLRLRCWVSSVSTTMSTMSLKSNKFHISIDLAIYISANIRRYVRIEYLFVDNMNSFMVLCKILGSFMKY